MATGRMLGKARNKASVSSLLKVLDVNEDGAPDILTSNNRGTFVFWGTQQGE